MGVLDIGASALHAAHTRLQATSNNIANASTPGYSRQEVNVAAREGQLLVGGYIGGGVEVTAVERQYDEFLARELDMSKSALAASQARANSLDRLDQIFSNSDSGIGARYDTFNAGVADMVNQPFDDATRSVALHRATELAKTINGTHGEMERIADDTLAQARAVATSINDRLQELAEVNGQINASDTVHSNQNDLLDRRDQLVSTISESIRVNSHINDNGTVSLFGATGDALVISQTASTLSVGIDVRDPGRLGLNLQTGDRDLPLNDDLLGGGKLAGLFEFYNEDLRDASARLGQMAAALTEGYNQQQANGLDRDGQPGSALFQISAPVTVAASINTGDAQISAQVVDGSVLKASDYTLEMQGGDLILTRLSDDQQTTLTGLPQTVDGLTFSLDSGALAEGDIIGIRSATAIAKDFSIAMQSPSQWANAYPAIPVTGEGNRGSLAGASFAVTDAGANTTAPVTLTFTGPDSFDVSGAGTGNPTGLTYAPGEAFSFNGWTLTMTGTPQLGDTLTVGPTADPSADNRNARAILALSNEPLADGNTVTESVSSLIGEVGARTQSAKADEVQSEIWKNSAQGARDSVSGVNLDEEAARLLQYQQAYQAAAKVISTAQVMFDSLLTIGR
ncbi:MAG: flagellar hook-associated protein FlgK [Burkholderiaceae bacterium]